MAVMHISNKEDTGTFEERGRNCGDLNCLIILDVCVSMCLCVCVKKWREEQKK